MVTGDAEGDDDDGEDGEDMVVGAPVTYDDEGDVDMQFVCEGGKSAEMNPLLNGHETVAVSYTHLTLPTKA